MAASNVSDVASELPKLYTKEEVADILHVSPKTVYLRVARGELGHVKVGRYLRISDRHIREFLQQQEGEHTDHS